MSSQPNTVDRSITTEKSKLVNKLTFGIKKALEDGDFQTAERLRDRLIEADPMAIRAVMEVAELIEKAMSAGLDKEHLAIWPELYDPLTTEERNCLFHSLKKYNLPEKKILLKYGSISNRLFFLEKGVVTVAIPQEENTFKVLAQLGRGDVFGEYTFATIALCSATALSKTPVQVRCLERKIAEGWEEKHPGLYDKILDFCKTHGRIDLISERKEQESHTHQRYHVQGRVKAVLLDASGQNTRIVFNGELEEISRSGTSFSIHCNNKAIVKQLLTRSFSLAFTCGIKGKEIRFSTVGKVVRVSFLLYNDYLVHIGFHSRLSADLDKELS